MQAEAHPSATTSDSGWMHESPGWRNYRCDAGSFKRDWSLMVGFLDRRHPTIAPSSLPPLSHSLLGPHLSHPLQILLHRKLHAPAGPVRHRQEPFALIGP